MTMMKKVGRLGVISILSGSMDEKLVQRNTVSKCGSVHCVHVFNNNYT